MEELTQALLGLLAAVVTALAGVAVQAVRAYATNLVQERIGAGAARVAGEIAAEVMGNDHVLAASREMIEAGAAKLAERFPDTAGKLPRETLMGMIGGELGRLGQAVTR
jgi:hypothetical protein